MKTETITETSMYICCPKCKNVLLQAHNGSYGTIKCSRCRSYVLMSIKDDIITIRFKEKEPE